MIEPESMIGTAEPNQGASSGGLSERRAAVYVRTSSTSQQYGYSIDEQRRQCIERCVMYDWTVVYLFTDEAESGKDTDRPMFQKMLAKAEVGAFDVLVFWKLDRFSRSIMHAVQLERRFRDWGVALHSVTEQLDTTSPAGRFNFRNLANAAEFEREMIRQRTKMGHAARAAEGKWPNGAPPLGYDLGADGRLEIKESEALLVREIFNQYRMRKSMPEVAEYLNDQLECSNGQTTWTPSSVSRILQTRLYLGEYSIGTVERVEPEYQIISDDVFEEATTIRTRFTSPGPASRNPMSRDRRKKRVKKVLSQYKSWHRGRGSEDS